MKAKMLDHQLSDNVRDFARQIWLAGLGAFARAQREGGQLFETLVQEGQAVDKRLRHAVHERTEQAKDEVTDEVDGAKGKVAVLRDQATGAWNKLEEVFQARVARALHRLGVPTQDDIRQLFQQVELLNRNIQELTQAAEARTRRNRAAKTAELVAVAKATDPAN
ncbi:MAG TPA: phasin family protein [Candidatus Competibacteraceae bacterium]|nr:phasin family protein [Candidatus Competibacteraceae bacterium]HQA26584.1 phasin family protein [Candidatus Competibacteraceae bacterium]HQD55814.1 phasin family protein [Candidatus Competibacteraceae bacterium]